MTDEERQAEIAAIVRERNSLRRDVICLENKLDRVKRAMSLVQSGLGTDRKLVAIQGGGIAASTDAPEMPPANEILEAQNQLVAAKARLDVLNSRLDGV